ncbi:MAG TPA: thioredoxin family protein [Erysipelothrix sp.]|nr:thioredoxin family protein [Erysipelothrix sp.]
MKKLFIVLMLLLVSACTGTSTPETNTTENLFDKTEYVNLTFEEYEAALENKVDGVYYFSWVEGCGDSRNLQKNYLGELLVNQPELAENLYVIDLDIENPEGLADHEKREPMKEKYGVFYSPTLFIVKDGVVIEEISWTPITSDANTAIPVADLDAFFAKTGYIK